MYNTPLKLPSGISLTSTGIYLNEQLLFPIAFDRIQRQVFLTDHSRETAYYCEFHTVSDTEQTNSSVPSQMSPLSFHSHFTCRLSNIPACLSELEAILDLPSKKSKRYLYLGALQEIFSCFQAFPDIKSVYISDRSGWFNIDGSWFYFTAEFVIGKEGIIPDWHCDPGRTYLKYDQTISASDTVSQLLELFESDFKATSIIWAQSILGHLRPLREKYFDFPTPTLLLTGQFSSFKTQFASRLGAFLTSENGGLENHLNLRNSPKILKQQLGNVSDTVCLLDDAFNTPSQRIREKMVTTLETSVRDTFSPSSPLTFLLTGEPGAMSKLGPSWVSRTVECNFSADENCKRLRSEILETLKQKPFLCRSCLRHFLAFIAGAIESDSLAALSSETVQDFESYFPRSITSDRSYDNLACLFWAFRIFLEFAVSCHAISPERQRCYEKRFSDILKQLALEEELNRRSGQPELLLLEILRHLKIHTAVSGSYSYPKTPVGYGKFGEYCNLSLLSSKRIYSTYGHHAIIDADEGYHGVYLENAQRLLGYASYKPKQSLLIVSYKEFAAQYSQIIAVGKILNPYLAYGNSPCRFLKELRQKNLLLTEGRYNEKHPEYANYRIRSYPFYCNGSLNTTLQQVLVFRIPPKMKEEIKKILDSSKNMCRATDQEDGFHSFYESSSLSNLCIADIEKCATALNNL